MELSAYIVTFKWQSCLTLDVYKLHKDIFRIIFQYVVSMSNFRLKCIVLDM